MWIIYTTAAAGADVRIKKNKTPLKGLNTEALHVLLPSRAAKTLKPRQHFNKYGENNV